MNVKIAIVTDYTSDLEQALQEWTAAKDAIHADRNLSDDGHKSALVGMRSQYENRVTSAGRSLFKALEDEQTERRATYADWLEKEQRAWEPGRLGLVRETLSARLVALGNNPAAVTALQEADAATGNPYLVRAWQLQAPVLAQSEREELQFLGFKLSRDLGEMLDPELHHEELQVASQRAGVRAHELLTQANVVLAGSNSSIMGQGGGLAGELSRLEKRHLLAPDGGFAQWVEVKSEGDGQDR